MIIWVDYSIRTREAIFMLILRLFGGSIKTSSSYQGKKSLQMILSVEYPRHGQILLAFTDSGGALWNL